MANRMYFVVLLLAFCLNNMNAQTADDNVVISNCTETYTFDTKKDVPIVKNSSETEYLATRARCVIEEEVGYGDYISLDNIFATNAIDKPSYKSVTASGIFHDDSKICCQKINLKKAGAHATLSYDRTYHDAKYFTCVMLPEDYYVRNKKVIIKFPRKYRLMEKNFSSSVTAVRMLKGEDSIVTYTITDMPAMKDEDNMPDDRKVYPCVFVIGAFENYKYLYKWSHAMSDVDCNVDNLPQLIAKITQGCKTRMEKLKATYKWVQKNIRYVAFEAGESGFKPDRPSEVLRKNYGDCKGKSLLLKTLLKAQNFDVRLTDVGTEEVMTDFSRTPDLSSMNHAICTLYLDGKTYYLDPTNEYISLNHISNDIQGREALVEDGENCRLVTLPVLPVESALDSVSIDYCMSGGQTLSGTVSYTTRGDMKGMLMHVFDNVVSGDKNEFMESVLNDANNSNKVSDAHWGDVSDDKTEAVLLGKIRNDNAVQIADGIVYLSMNPDNDLFDDRIDTTKRVYDYVLPMKCKVVRNLSVTIPKGYKVKYIPDNFSVTTAQGILRCIFARSRGGVTLRKEMIVTDRVIKRKNIPVWNNAIERWDNACNEQVMLSK
nr:transglutaminase family protein [Prevotella sp.]